MPKRGDSFGTASYVPAFGDIVHLDWSPTIGREMKDPHYGLVISATAFNQATGIAAIVPITSKGGKISSFELPVRSGRVDGVAVISDIRCLDYMTRKIEFENHGAEATAIAANKRIHLFLPAG